MCAGALSVFAAYRLSVSSCRGVRQSLTLRGARGVCLSICRAVSVSVSVAAAVFDPQAFEQVFRTGVSNKCTKQVFERLFGPVWLAVQPNPDRISES
jgi:hypothetical protein